MKILILGGTRFLGRHLAEAALARGHEITLFNRGQSNPDLFPELENLRGDRNDDLQALKGRQWDAVIDPSGQVSRQVLATATLLAPSVEHYTFISSASVYADFSRPDLDEAAATLLLPSGVTEEETDQQTYGARKFLCEQAAEKIMPGRVLNIRPGIIIGPHDLTGRFTYWVRRVAQGGDTLAPENPHKPLQLIDVRDLADWIVQRVEKKQVGVFNATGPKESLTFGAMLEACKGVVGSDARFTWVDGQFLLDQSVQPWSDLPLWIPRQYKEYAGFYSINSARAFQFGLVSRPIEQSVRDVFQWDRDFTGVVKPPGLSPEREQRLLQIWNCSGQRR